MKIAKLILALLLAASAAYANAGHGPPDDADCLGKEQDPLYVQRGNGTPPKLFLCGPDGWEEQVSQGGASLPAGVIVMWSGALANIPAGWALCDGQGGRPDLRGMFVKGAAAGVDPGATGGSPTHGHAYTDVVQHTHSVNVNDPGHTHLTQRYPTATGGSSGFTIDTSMSGTLADNTLPTKTGTTGVTATTSNPGGSVATGNTQTASSEPPFYSVAYIIKL